MSSKDLDFKNFELSQQIFDAIPAGVNIIDENFTIQKVNRWMEEKFKHDQPLIGKKCYTVTHNCNHHHPQCPSVQALKSGHVETATVSIGSPPHLEWARITSFPLRDENNHVYGCIEYIVDMSDKKRDEQLQSVMLEISNAAHNAADTVDLIRKIRDVLSKVIETSNFFIAIYDKEKDQLSLPFFADQQDHFQTLPAGKTLTRYVIELGKPVLLHANDALRLKEQGHVELHGSPAKVWLGVPLITKNTVFGALVVQSYTDENEFTERELDILKFVSDQIAMTLEKKQIEENLNYERALMQALLENTPDFIYFKDVQGRFIKSSRSHAHYLGKKDPKEILGKSDFDFYPGDVAQRYFDGEQESLKTQTSTVIKEEKAHLIRDHDEWYSTTKIPLKDEHENVIGIFGITRNISMQKRAEQELRQSEIQYRTTLNAIIDPVHVVDPKLRIILVNDALIQLNRSLGLETDVFGKKYHDIYTFLDEDVKKEYQHVFETGEIVKTEEENQINGRLMYSESRKIPIFEDGRVTQVLTVIRDTTNRHQREVMLARLAAAVEQAGDSITIIDKNGVIEYVNPEAERTLGKPKNELVGKTADILKTEKYPKEFYSEIWRTMAAGNTWNGHLASQHTDGSLIEQDVTISPVFNENGELQNFVAVSRDVTNEIEMQKQLVQSQKMEAIGTLAGGIAHDFNNILAAIVGFTQLSQMQVTAGSRLDKNLANILKACDRARDLTQQILLYSRGDEQEKHPLHISLVVKEVIKLLKASLPSTISISYFIDENTGFILGTSTQIHQILMNLATNAAHAMLERAGKINITLRPHRELEGDGSIGKYVQLEVQDNGSGIPKDIQNRIFDPFFTTKSGSEGTGLGLSVVHGIVSSLGGRISVVSEPDHGAQFTILLPELDLSKSTVSTRDEFDVPRGHETILFIDDEVDLVQIARDILTNLGYNVITSTNSSDGLALFSEAPEQFDLIITDQTMPHMTGEKVAENVHKIRPDIPIILCTGYNDEHLASRQLSKAISKVLLKPFYIDEISHVIRELLD